MGLATQFHAQVAAYNRSLSGKRDKAATLRQRHECAKMDDLKKDPPPYCESHDVELKPVGIPMDTIQHSSVAVIYSISPNKETLSRTFDGGLRLEAIQKWAQNESQKLRKECPYSSQVKRKNDSFTLRKFPLLLLISAPCPGT